MSTHTQQRNTTDTEVILQPKGNAAGTRGTTLAETNRVIAAAAKSFESSSAGGSPEFLQKSRQSGGE